MAPDSRERVIWFIGLQAKALWMSTPFHLQQVAYCFVGPAQLPSLDQVRPGEYPDLLVLDVAAEPELVSQISRLRRTWLAPLLALAPDCETAERCLLAGARDVVIVPWTPAEVRLRVHRLLHIPVSLLHTGDLALDLVARELHLAGANVSDATGARLVNPPVAPR